MTWEVFDAWSERSVRGFADQQVAAGLASPVAALGYARRQLAAQLPDGIATPTHWLWVAHLAEGPVPDGSDAARPGAVVGHLWMRVRPTTDGVEATVLDVDVDAALRGRGLGRAIMLAALDAAAALGATVVRLTVFGHNLAARALYARLGFTAERTLLSRPVAADAVRREGPALRLVAMTEAERAVLQLTIGRAPAAARRREHHLWTAWDGDEQVGRLWLQPDEASAADGGRRVSVHVLEVAAAARGRGRGRALVGAADAECRALGAVSMTVSLTGQDSGVRAFCERVGFTLTAQLMARPSADRPAGPSRRSAWPSG